MTNVTPEDTDFDPERDTSRAEASAADTGSTDAGAADTGSADAAGGGAFVAGPTGQIEVVEPSATSAQLDVAEASDQTTKLDVAEASDQTTKLDVAEASDTHSGTADTSAAPDTSDAATKRLEVAEPVPLIEPDEPPAPYRPVTPYEPVAPFDGRSFDGHETDAPGYRDSSAASADPAPAAAQGNATGPASTGQDAPTAAYSPAFEPRFYEPPTEAYPQPTVGDYSAIGQLGLGQPDATPAPPAFQQPIYVQAPIPPTRKGNRGIGTLMALVGTVVFALVYAGVAALIILGTNTSNELFSTVYTRFLTSWMFWAAIIGFTVVLIVLVLIANRANWWAYVLGGFLVGVGAYIATIGGAYIAESGWNMTQSEGMAFLGQVARSPFTIAAGVVAREATVWIGAWIAWRGRKMKLHNSEAQAEYQRQLQAVPGFRP